MTAEINEKGIVKFFCPHEGCAICIRIFMPRNYMEMTCPKCSERILLNKVSSHYIEVTPLY